MNIKVTHLLSSSSYYSIFVSPLIVLISELLKLGTKLGTSISISRPRPSHEKPVIHVCHSLSTAQSEIPLLLQGKPLANPDSALPNATKGVLTFRTNTKTIRRRFCVVIALRLCGRHSRARHFSNGLFLVRGLGICFQVDCVISCVLRAFGQVCEPSES